MFWCYCVYFLSGCCTLFYALCHSHTSVTAAGTDRILSGFFLTANCQSEHHYVRQCVCTHPHTQCMLEWQPFSQLSSLTRQTVMLTQHAFENLDQLLERGAAWNLGSLNKSSLIIPSVFLLFLVWFNSCLCVIIYFLTLLLYLCSFYQST